MLICIPICAGAGDVAMRKMRKLSELVVSFYGNLTLLVMSAILIIVLPRREGAPDDKYIGFTFFKDLDLTTWILIFLNSLNNILTTTTKFSAFKYQQPAKL